MFISRVELPWDAVRNPYDIHRRLWCMFPDLKRESRSRGEEARQGFLFRIEDLSTGRPARLLVQSPCAPTRAEGLILHGSRELRPKPGDGQRLGFILTANPVKTVTDAERELKPGKKSKKCRVPLIKEEEQRQWLIRKLCGAAKLESADILPHTPLYFRKGNRAGKLVTCIFEGRLQVVSGERLVELLENGIGPAKAFGCGLLLVRCI